MSVGYNLISSGPAAGTVLLDNQVHGPLSSVVALIMQSYQKSTWAKRAPRLEAALNAFFQPVEGTSIPVPFVHADLARDLIMESLQREATVVPKGGGRVGYNVSHDTDIERIDQELHQGRKICDQAILGGHSVAENPFLLPGLTPAMLRALNAANKVATRDDQERDYRQDTGRYFSIERPPREAPRVDDPKLFDKVDRALAKHCPDTSMLRASQMQGSIISRPSETIEMTFASPTLGAQMIGKAEFCRLLIIKDKLTGPKLLKPAVIKRGFAPVFYEDWIDNERREHDPRGWGLAEYQRECFAGNPEALAAPIFLNTEGGGLKYDTARKRRFAPAMRKARIMFQDKPITMSLRRHNGVNELLDFIEELDLPRYIKDRMREAVIELIGWRDPNSIKSYSAFHDRMRKIREMFGLQDTLVDGGDASTIAAKVLGEERPDWMRAAWRNAE